MLAACVRGLDEQGVTTDRAGAPHEIRREGVQVPREEGRFGPIDLVHRRAGNVTRGMRGDLEVADVHIVPDRKSTRLNSSHIQKSRMPSSA